MSGTLMAMAYGLITAAFIVFVVVIVWVWRWHNRTVMSKPSCSDAEFSSLFAPRPVVPKPEGYKEESDLGTLRGVLRRIVGMH